MQSDQNLPLRLVGFATWAMLSYVLLTEPPILDGRYRESLRLPQDFEPVTPVLVLSLIAIGVSFGVATRPDESRRGLTRRRASSAAMGLAMIGLAVQRPDPIQLIFVVLLGGALPFIASMRLAFAIVTISYLAVSATLSLYWYSSSIIQDSILYYLFALFALAVSGAALKERQTRQELARVNTQLVATQRLLRDSAVQGERLRISRDLHDSVGHHLTAMSLQLEVAHHLATGDVSSPVDQARSIAKLLLSDVRQVVADLRDESALDIKESLNQLTKASKVPVHLEISKSLSINEVNIAETLFRLVQEIITNSNRHSHGNKLIIVVAEDDTHWTLSAHDDVHYPVEVVIGAGLRG
jgi:signal transduction histidine kinase